MVVWDSGGGSFQITTKSDDGLKHFLGDFAVAAVTKMCAEDAQGKDYATAASTNPVSPSETAKLIELIRARVPNPRPSWLVKVFLSS